MVILYEDVFPTWVVYDSDKTDEAAAKIVAQGRGLPLLQTAEDKNPAEADPMYDECNLVCIGLWPANAYTGYYFPEIYKNTNWTTKTIDKTKVEGVDPTGKWVINTVIRKNGTKVTVVGGVEAKDTLAAAKEYVATKPLDWVIEAIPILVGSVIYAV